jgi:hypothetical protein
MEIGFAEKCGCVARVGRPAKAGVFFMTSSVERVLKSTTELVIGLIWGQSEEKRQLLAKLTSGIPYALMVSTLMR